MTLPQKDMLENVQHSTEYIPYSFYECDIPRWFVGTPMHWHSEFELDYVIYGTGEFICGGKKYTAGEGALFLLPPNMLHAAYPHEGNELFYYALVFNPTMLGTNDRCTMEHIRPLTSGACQIHPFIPKTAKNYSGLRASAERIFSCIVDHIECSELLLKSELFRLFWLLATDGDILFQETVSGDYGDRIRPALEYMIKNFRVKISIAHLASVSHMSESYFMNSFKKAVGVSAVEYLNQLRIHAACEALSTTEDAVSEIALACGYGNLSNFNRQFRRISGCSPKEYRRQYG